MQMGIKTNGKNVFMYIYLLNLERQYNNSGLLDMLIGYV